MSFCHSVQAKHDTESSFIRQFLDSTVSDTGQAKRELDCGFRRNDEKEIARLRDKGTGYRPGFHRGDDKKPGYRLSPVLQRSPGFCRGNGM